jgi:LmbE family N-acetylglucosaminyl deacetylase
MPPDFVVDVRPWVARKLAALRCHRTQMNPNSPFASIGDAEAKRLLGFERFRRAPLERGWSSVLEQLGEPVASV